MMLTNTVREEWNDFEEKCLHEKSQEVVQMARDIFYAAYNASLLMVMRKLREGAPVEDVMALENECYAYFTVRLGRDSDGGAAD